jgi:two-component system cell cycle sensor histidine kinase/response regulator CckA
VDLNSFLLERQAHFKSSLGPSINLRYSLASSAPPIAGDIEQLESVLDVFLSNAKKAMPHGGQLLIQTREVIMPENEAFPKSNTSSYLMLAISDSGNGIPAEFQNRIHELLAGEWRPMTGALSGLAKAKAILDRHQARILMYSLTVRGTSFKIYFPLNKNLEMSRFPSTPAPKGTETLLFVEDDSLIRHLYTKYLRQRGYHVLEAQHGKEAFEVYENFKGHIHLMVTDVVMPELNGRQLVDMVSLNHPPPKVLYISGFTKDAIVQRGILKADMPFLEKPFGREELAMRIRQLLDTPS